MTKVPGGGGRTGKPTQATRGGGSDEPKTQPARPKEGEAKAAARPPGPVAQPAHGPKSSVLDCRSKDVRLRQP
eukprot:8711087-Alexandrium_andersonii.AAC.1